MTRALPTNSASDKSAQVSPSRVPRQILISLGGDAWTDGDDSVVPVGECILPSVRATNPLTNEDDSQSTWNPADINIKNPAYFELAGMGERGENCGCRRISKFGVDPTTGRIKTTVQSCKRMVCPRCYKNWVIERTFTNVVLLESYARVNGIRPAGVTASVHPDLQKDWTWRDFNHKLHRRALRHIKKMGATGGTRYFHSHRVAEWAKASLRELGYGTQGNGYWKGVRGDVLELGHWKKYTQYGPHDHLICFPSFLDEHSDEDFYVAKYDVFEGVENLVRHVRYLLSHVGKVDGTLDQPTSKWGVFSGANRWVPEDHMDKDVLDDLKREVAALLHRRWDPVEGLTYLVEPDDDGIEWESIYRLPTYMANEDWVEALGPDAYHGFKLLRDAVLTPDSEALEWVGNEGLGDLLDVYHSPPLVDDEVTENEH